mgnify:CR=1 FL=1
MPIDKILAFGGAIVQGARAKREAKRYRKQQKALNDKINHLEANRQDVINPYDQVTSLASMATDLSNTFSNPMANLSVATQAAEMQIEQADISLANTLDTLRATGSGAGGATALARMALESKKGISASIETQEANNNQLRARGEQNLQAVKLSEAKRVQGALMGEAGRMQQAETAGAIFKFDKTETRQMQELNRQAAIQQGQQQAEVNAIASGNAAIASGISAVGSVAGGLASNANF